MCSKFLPVQTTFIYERIITKEDSTNAIQIWKPKFWLMWTYIDIFILSAELKQPIWVTVPTSRGALRTYIYCCAKLEKIIIIYNHENELPINPDIKRYFISAITIITLVRSLEYVILVRLFFSVHEGVTYWITKFRNRAFIARLQITNFSSLCTVQYLYIWIYYGSRASLRSASGCWSDGITLIKALGLIKRSNHYAACSGSW